MLNELLLFYQVMKGDINYNNNNKKNLSIESLIEGSTTFIGGIAGGLLSSCISHNIPCSVIFIPTHSGIPESRWCCFDN